MSRTRSAGWIVSAGLIAYFALGAALLRWEGRAIAGRGTWLAALVVTSGLWLAGAYPFLRALTRRAAARRRPGLGSSGPAA